jgi:hypothetical protein
MPPKLGGEEVKVQLDKLTVTNYVIFIFQSQVRPYQVYNNLLDVSSRVFPTY